MSCARSFGAALRENRDGTSASRLRTLQRASQRRLQGFSMTCVRRQAFALSPDRDF